MMSAFMRQKTCSIVLSLVFVTFSAGSLSGGEQGGWTMEFRITANPFGDAKVVRSGRSSDELKIYDDGTLVGKWVEVAESAERHLEEDPSLVTRRSEQGRLQLLVLISSNDVTEKDVRRISPSKDRYGGLALRFRFSDEGSSKLFNLTEKYAYQKLKYCIATIMDGKVTATPIIVMPVREVVQIAGDFDEGLIEDIRQRSKKGLVVTTYDEPPPYAITVTPLRLAVFFAVAFFVIVGSLPAKGLEKSKHPKVWTVVGIIAGILVGAYKLGVTERTGVAAVGVWDVDAVRAVHIVTQIALLWVLVGGAIGAGFGYLIGRLCRFFVRRAIHNVAALVFRSGRWLQQEGTAREHFDE